MPTLDRNSAIFTRDPANNELLVRWKWVGAAPEAPYESQQIVAPADNFFPYFLPDNLNWYVRSFEPVPSNAIIFPADFGM